jgi:putative protease
MAAIKGKANAVYFGIGKLNMRAKSTLNFTADDLKNIREICNEHNIKCYITLNTVIYNDDLDEMREVINLVKQHGIDAIIASDQAVINYAHKIGVEVHISTQLNISNYETVEFYAPYANVMVLARELNMHQVKEIHNAIEQNNLKGPDGKPVRIEMFCHGALCMAVSGKCYLSLHHFNHSANRGACLQQCRRSYVVTDKETGHELEIDNEYIMSPKDLCTIGFLDIMINAGVRVFKIEGRARSAEYVKTVCECYNEALNNIVEQTYNEELKQILTQKLSTVFNRGFWDGYYMGQKLGEWSSVYGSKATKKKVYIAKAMNYFSNIGVAEFLVETGTLNIGDEIIITGPTTGVIETKVNELRVDLNKVGETVKGQRFSMPVPDVIRKSDKLYKLVDNKI